MTRRTSLSCDAITDQRGPWHRRRDNVAVPVSGSGLPSSLQIGSGIFAPRGGLGRRLSGVSHVVLFHLANAVGVMDVFLRVAFFFEGVAFFSLSRVCLTVGPPMCAAMRRLTSYRFPDWGLSEFRGSPSPWNGYGDGRAFDRERPVEGMMGRGAGSERRLDAAPLFEWRPEQF